MSKSDHAEKHFLASATVRDVVIGMSDGLTVPFALAAGLSGAVAASKFVVIAGSAEVAAGAIAMGLGGYLAARTEAEHYHSEYRRELRETVELPAEEHEEVLGIFRKQGLDEAQAMAVTDTLIQDRHRWVRFMMRFELGLEEPNPARAIISATTIGGSYVVGGLIPLFPYMLMPSVAAALPVSIVATLMALFGFGAVKGRLTGVKWRHAGLQTLVVGGAAAAAAFAIARFVAT